MATIISRLAPLKPEIRLAQAISQFEADLSTPQKATFQSYRSQCTVSPPSIQDVMQVTAEIDCPKPGRVGGGRGFGPRLTNVLEAIQQFAALGDVIVGGSQNIIACSVWALVRFSLLSIVNISSYMEKLSALLMTIGRSAPRYEEMGLLYPRSRQLQSYLSEYFIVLVHLCHHLLRSTQKSLFRQLPSFLIDFDIKSYQSDLDSWAIAIKEEVNLMTAKRVQEQSSWLSTISSLSASGSHRRRLRTHLKIRESCSKYDYQQTWKQIRKVGNSTLFSHSREYQPWKMEAESSTLAIIGKLGSGKSVLLANIVDDLNLHGRNGQDIVAYFFCRHDVQESLKARTILGCLMRQLLHSIPDSVLDELSDITITDLDVEQLSSLVKRTLLPGSRAYFIVDGLDECTLQERHTLIEQLQEFQNAFALLVCLSVRLEPRNEFNLHLLHYGHLARPRIVSMPDNNPDIESFINTELERCIESGKLIIGDPSLIREIRDALLKGAQGMFLWVALQIDSLCAARTDEAIGQALRNLPKDLPETFSRILRKARGAGECYQKRVFELCTVACRPLTTQELQEAMSVVPGNADWNPARLINDIYSVLAYCGSLITVDEEELTVQLVHHSVKQFLLGGLEGSIGESFTMESAHRMMADIVITYLNYGIFNTQLSTRIVPQIDYEMVPAKIIRSTLNPPTVRNLALKLLKSHFQHDYGIRNVLADASNNFNQPSKVNFQFYHYAKLYWLQHAQCTIDQEPPVQALFITMLKEKRAEIDINDGSGQALLSWAVKSGREVMVRLLLRDVGLEVQDNFLELPAKTGHDSMCQLLMDSGAKIDEWSSEAPSLLQAARNGHQAIVRLLLDYGANVEEKLNGITSLYLAASTGHTAVVQLLLGKGADIEARSDFGITALISAASVGERNAVQLLIDSGADIEARSDFGITALISAASVGKRDIVQLLIDSGADIERRSDHGITALIDAAQNEHEAIFQLLSGRNYNIKAVNHQYGMTAEGWANEYGRTDIARLLRMKRLAELDS
ncbi:hypothetical protein F5B20DRAFT_557779 [Whalleya microplaca]|nr:hypothetical protein F5B20DRAFT_557779 [Whalleya microplaca]